MKVMRARLFTALFLVVLFGAPASAAPAPRAEKFTACVEKAAAVDFAGKEAFQTALHDLVVSRASRFETVSSVNRDLQIAMARAQTLRIIFLAARSPARITTGEGLSKFTNFGWSQDDTAVLAKQSREYRALESTIWALGEQNNGHPDWPAFREFSGTLAARGPEFAALTADFQASQKDVEALIARCNAP